MNNKRIKTLIITLLLIVGLLLFSIGCAEQSNAVPSASPIPAYNGNSGASAASETYSAQFIQIAEYDSEFTPLAFDGESFVVLSHDKVSDATTGTSLESEDLNDDNRIMLYSIGLDGSVNALKDYEPLETDENSSTNLISLVIAEEDQIVSLEFLYRSWYEGPDDEDMYSDAWYQKQYYLYMGSEYDYLLRYFDFNGNEEKRIELNSALTEALGMHWHDSYFISSFSLDSQGRIYLNTNQVIIVLEADGSLRKLIEIPTPCWVDSLLRLKDERIGVMYSDGAGEHFSVINTESLELDLKQSFFLGNAQGLTADGKNFDVCYTNGSNFMGAKMETGNSEMIFNWINTGVDPSIIKSVFVMEDGRIVAFGSERDTITSKSNSFVVLIDKVPTSSLPNKSIITLATLSLDSTLQHFIVEYNRSSSEYRVEIRDYSEYNTGEDSQAGRTKLNTEIMAGNVPDIINLNGLPAGKLATQGILEDLMPYLNADAELKDQIFANVLQALMTEGKLYRTASGFKIQTVIGLSSIVGDKPGWNLEEFNAALKTMPTGCEPFGQGIAREDILSWCLSMEMNKLVDWTTGFCAFDTPVFTSILKFADQFPEEIDWENILWEDEPERISSGKQMLMITWISDFNSYQLYEAIFAGEITFIGFPTNEGIGNMMSFDDSGYGICANSKNKDASWQFLRTLLTSEYQEQYVWSLPTNRVAFEKKLKDAMTPEYERDENGKFVLDENGERIEVAKSQWGWGSLRVQIKALKQEDADRIIELVNTTTKVQNSDITLISMINNEAEAFFSKQKSAEEVGRLLQSKISIYISEQR